MEKVLFKVMGIKDFEKRAIIFDLKEKLLVAEEQRLSGKDTISLEDAQKSIKKKIEKDSYTGIDKL